MHSSHPGAQSSPNQDSQSLSVGSAKRYLACTNPKLQTYAAPD